MNKNLSLAIEKAVEKATPKDNFTHQKDLGDKKPDLFSDELLQVQDDPLELGLEFL